MKFSLQLLGGASLIGADGPVRGRAAHKRRLALLAVLASVRGRAVPRERLLVLLWPDSPSQAGRHLISESLSVLRRELGEDVFICTGDDLRLNRDLVACDADAFESALEAEDPEAASRLYGGPFLDGFYVGDAPDFEKWADEERDRLGRLYARMLETLAEKRTAEGRLREAAESWRLLAVHDRFSSRVALRLVQALEAAGEREAALRYAAVHAAFLREELGTEPAPDLRAYVERLRLAPPPAAAAADPPPAAKSAQQDPVAQRGPAGDEAAAAKLRTESLPADEEALSASSALAPARAQAVPVGPVQLETTGEAEAPRAAAVWFADIVGYSALLARDAEGAGIVLRVLQEVAGREVRRADGQVVELIGDAVLAEFPDVAACARSAVRLVRAFERRTIDLAIASTLRVGVHFGTVSTADDGGIYGEAVSVATRLQRRADTGQVVASGEVHARLRSRPEYRFTGCGMVVVPGEPAAIPAFDLRLERRSAGDAPLAKAVPGAMQGRRRRRIWTAGAVGAALAVGTAALFNIVTSPRTAVSKPRLDPNRIAILYFTPSTPDPDLRALAKGFTDQLINELSQVEALDVVPPSGVRPYRDRLVPLDSVALALKAGTLLEGNLERSGQRLRMTLYLIDAASGQRLRTKVLDARAGDPFALEDQLGAEAARFLRWRLGRSLEVQAHSAGTENVRARQLVVLAEQAREDARSNYATKDSVKAILARQQLAYADSLLRQAAEADPRWLEPVLTRG